jgi:hypothetical protein
LPLLGLTADLKTENTGIPFELRVISQKCIQAEFTIKVRIEFEEKIDNPHHFLPVH